MNIKHFGALFKARTMEFLRDKETFIWNLAFPVVLVFGFAFAFSGNNQAVFKVGTLGSVPSDISFVSIEHISFVAYPDNPSDSPKKGREKALARLSQHQLDLVLDFETGSYFVNDQSPTSLLAKRILEGSDQKNTFARLKPQLSSGEAIRYVDWLVPGVIGMNIMFSCLFGVGYVIVRYRKNGVLKRLKATPVTASTFIIAHAISRLMIVLVTSVLVYTATNLFLGFMMKGSYLVLLLLTVMAGLCMISLGLIFASRLKSEELANGLMNLVTMPMLLGSGVFFSLDGTPQVLQSLSRIFPLTHFIEAARAVMLQGAGIVEILPNLIVLGSLTLVFFLLSTLSFKWE